MIEKIEFLGMEVFLLNGLNVGIIDDLLISNFICCYKVRENWIMYLDEIYILIIKIIGLLWIEGLFIFKLLVNNDGLFDLFEIIEGVMIFLLVEK